MSVWQDKHMVISRVSGCVNWAGLSSHSLGVGKELNDGLGQGWGQQLTHPWNKEKIVSDIRTLSYPQKFVHDLVTGGEKDKEN